MKTQKSETEIEMEKIINEDEWDNHNLIYCENCEEQKVENKGDWCDDCNLPERRWIK